VWLLRTAVPRSCMYESFLNLHFTSHDTEYGCWSRKRQWEEWDCRPDMGWESDKLEINHLAKILALIGEESEVGEDCRAGAGMKV